MVSNAVKYLNILTTSLNVLHIRMLDLANFCRYFNKIIYSVYIYIVIVIFNILFLSVILYRMYKKELIINY